MKFPVFSLHNREFWTPETSSLVTRPSTGESAANLRGNAHEIWLQRDHGASSLQQA